MKWTGLEIQVQSVPEMSLTTLDFDHEFPVLTPMKSRKKQTRSLRVKASSDEIREPIAIIGMSGRFPQAETLVDYWENLKAGKCCITEIPEERWPLEGFYHPNKQEAIAKGKAIANGVGLSKDLRILTRCSSIYRPGKHSIWIRKNDCSSSPAGKCWRGCRLYQSATTAQYHGRVGVFAGITKTGFDLYGPDLWKQGEPYSLILHSVR